MKVVDQRENISPCLASLSSLTTIKEDKKTSRGTGEVNPAPNAPQSC